MKIVTIVGIRPDFIRMSQIIKKLDESRADQILVHAGQHYSFNMDKIFFDEMSIRAPDHNLEVGSGSHAEQAAKLFVETEKLLFKVKPHLCIVLGDSNTALASVVAAKCNVKVAHIEAGMRSFDWRMPEEKNRTIVDHISDYLYAYTQLYRDNLLMEGVPGHRIMVTHNPIVDVVNTYLPLAQEAKILSKLGVRPKEYVLVTAHRAENVDSYDALDNIVKGLKLVTERLDVPIVFPVYYRTQNKLKEMGLSLPKGIIATEPLGFLDFLCLEANALCLITDSGTVQEEGCILGVPCVTMRISTERPETVQVGANLLSGVEPNRILECTQKMIHAKHTWANPLGDGRASSRIVDDILAREKEIEDFSVEVPYLDTRKRASFSTFVSPESRLRIEPPWLMNEK